MRFVQNLSDIRMSDVMQFGGKNASLGELISQLSQYGIQVPKGFATNADAYLCFLKHNNLHEKIQNTLAKIDVNNIAQLEAQSKAIRQEILNAHLPDDFIAAIKDAYSAMQLAQGQAVAVRSSATTEDLDDASFAGQQETFLNVVGIDDVLQAIKKVYASLFTSRAIAYRQHKGFAHVEAAISVGVQQMVRSDLAVSGVAFTLDTESGFDKVVFITSGYGLGEAMVQGLINPDEFFVYKPTLQQGKAAIIKRHCGSKTVKMIYQRQGGSGVETIPVPEIERTQFCLSDAEILHLAKQACIIEKHYGKPMDIEWAKDGIDQQIYILQARPETVKSQQNYQVLEQYQLNTPEKPLVSGRSVGQKIASGVARIIREPRDMDALQPGEILVAPMTDPDWEPVMKRAAAIVTDRGGRTCHAAIIARELGIPAVVGCNDATEKIKDGQAVTVSCAQSETGYIYPGLLDFQLTKTRIDNLPKLPVKICMNLANPEQAFLYQFLPNEGIGLARLEFIIGNMIAIHPNALLEFDKLPKKLQQEIQTKIAAYASPVEFYIEKLAEGIATIAAAFYPKPIIVRFSDFKSNEYANLLGGEIYEPKEENPMIGYRGASRYTSGNFIPAFVLECLAIKRVREDKGLTNTHVMFPFVRTVDEAKQLVQLIQDNGLKRGKEGLQLFMMCEIPSNALLAEEFLQLFDGYSIGSNDLTQLTLGLDRDSALVAHLFDERNLAVKALLQQIISTCKKLDKYVGICGQGPSDHLDFAEWLMQQGIDSMSLTPDSIVKTWLALAKKGE